jgi:NAD(P)H dehydrogenase (quinone)
MSVMRTLLVLNGHPEADGLCADLTAAYVQAAGVAAPVVRIDLRELRFDPLLRRANQPLEPDLQRASEAILAAGHVTWIFPTWWSATPALVKGFVDRVLTAGFAFRYRGRNQVPERLLTGRSARVISPMDSPGFWYQLVQGRPLHKAFVSGTLGFCGFDPIATSLIYEARFLDTHARDKALSRMRGDAERDARRLSRRSATAGAPQLSA